MLFSTFNRPLDIIVRLTLINRRNAIKTKPCKKSRHPAGDWEVKAANCHGSLETAASFKLSMVADKDLTPPEDQVTTYLL